MEKQQSRRGLIKSAAKAAVAVTGGAMVAKKAAAQSSGHIPVKKAYYPLGDTAPKPGGKKPLVTPAVGFGNLVFVSGVGAHFKGTIQEHTTFVLDSLEKRLVGAGSSLQKVLMVNIYLNDLKDFEAMNTIYSQRNWGEVTPARTTVAPAGGVPGNSLVEINCIAHI